MKEEGERRVRDWEGRRCCLKGDASASNTATHKICTLSERGWEEKMLPSLILHCWAGRFFLTQAHGLTHSASLCARLLPPNAVLNPISLRRELQLHMLTGANSPRQHHMLWHHKHKDDLAGWLVRVQMVHVRTWAHTETLAKCGRLYLADIQLATNTRDISVFDMLEITPVCTISKNSPVSATF